MMNDFKKIPHCENPRSAHFVCAPEEFSEEFELYIEYMESLTAGDIRPIVIKDYKEER